MVTLLDAAAHLFLGSVCPGCRLPSWSLCRGCRTLLADPAPRAVRRGGLEGVTVLAANDYRPLLEHLVPAFKDDGALHLERVLGHRLAVAVAALQPPPGAVLVPVPSLASKVRARGYDHGRRLAAVAARRTGLRWRPLLVRATTGQDQRVLGRQGRSRNVAGSMRARPSSAPVVLCDDVCTTGSSLAEALRALRSVGAEVHGIAVVGDADRTRGAQVSDIPHPARRTG
ncbi:ComF family protein [Tessaracoccus terricola]